MAKKGEREIKGSPIGGPSEKDPAYIFRLVSSELLEAIASLDYEGVDLARHELARRRALLQCHI